MHKKHSRLERLRTRLRTRLMQTAWKMEAARRQTGSGTCSETGQRTDRWLQMLAGREHLIMFQQQLVASEQQMPRHPTAINPPAGRKPAALRLCRHHGDGRREHTDLVKVGRSQGDGRSTRVRLPLFSPRRSPAVCFLQTSWVNVSTLSSARLMFVYN